MIRARVDQSLNYPDSSSSPNRSRVEPFRLTFCPSPLFSYPDVSYKLLSIFNLYAVLLTPLFRFLNQKAKRFQRGWSNVEKDRSIGREGEEEEEEEGERGI